jgi:hypothetical protein
LIGQNKNFVKKEEAAEEEAEDHDSAFGDEILMIEIRKSGI